MKKTGSAAALLLSVGIAACIACAGCISGCGNAVSSSDLVSSQNSGESQEPVRLEDPSQAVSVLINGEKTDEVFMLQYNWYGREFESEDSLNKMMLDHYVPKGQHAPFSPDKAEISFVFDPAAEAPSTVRLTQYANTVRADSGIPYDTSDITPDAKDTNTYSFTLSFRTFKMYYYVLECSWKNGNTARYAFAVEKTK